MAALSLTGPDGSSASFIPRQAIIAGWAGRDRDAIDHHVEELAALGVAPPSAVPLYYRVGAGLFTNAAVIDVLGPESSGEVEPVIFSDGKSLRLGLGSDHTDRALEAHSVAASKQICPKPVATGAWDFAEVEGHADTIELYSWIRDMPDAEWTLYQRGSLKALRPVRELMEGAIAVHGKDDFIDNCMMMCGTIGVVSGGIRPARYFRIFMNDPVLGRSIEHSYETRILPVVY